MQYAELVVFLQERLLTVDYSCGRNVYFIYNAYFWLSPMLRGAFNGRRISRSLVYQIYSQDKFIGGLPLQEGWQMPTAIGTSRPDKSQMLIPATAISTVGGTALLMEVSARGMTIKRHWLVIGQPVPPP